MVFDDTDTNGCNLYASCLTYYEDLPAAVVCSNPAWLGAKASKCLSIVSKYPYFTTMEAILKRLFASMFLSGTHMSIADVLQHIMSVPCPGLGNLADASQVRTTHKSAHQDLKFTQSVEIHFPLSSYLLHWQKRSSACKFCFLSTSTATFQPLV